MRYVSLLPALLIAASVSAQTTWFGPTDAPNSNATLSTTTAYNVNLGVSFMTGSSSPFYMDNLLVRLNTSTVTSGSASFNVALRNVTQNGTPYLAVAGSTELAVDTVTFTMPTTFSTNFNMFFDATDLANISNYAMQSNTAYALIFYNASAPIGIQSTTGYAQNTTNDYYYTSEGFVALNTFRNNTTWTNSPGSYPTLSIVFGSSSSAVPEPSTYGLALGGLALVAVALKRRNKTKA
jgi:hypothetical protein